MGEVRLLLSCPFSWCVIALGSDTTQVLQIGVLKVGSGVFLVEQIRSGRCELNLAVTSRPVFNC